MDLRIPYKFRIESKKNYFSQYEFVHDQRMYFKFCKENGIIFQNCQSQGVLEGHIKIGFGREEDRNFFLLTFNNLFNVK